MADWSVAYAQNLRIEGMSVYGQPHATPTSAALRAAHMTLKQGYIPDWSIDRAAPDVPVVPVLTKSLTQDRGPTSLVYQEIRNSEQPEHQKLVNEIDGLSRPDYAKLCRLRGAFTRINLTSPLLAAHVRLQDASLRPGAQLSIARTRAALAALKASASTLETQT